MESLRLKPKLVPMHKIMDGINGLRVLFPRIWWDRKCGVGLEALRQYRADYDDKKRVFRDTPLHDWTSHAADAARYMGMAYREMAPAPVAHAKPLQGVMDMSFDELIAAPSARESSRI